MDLQRIVACFDGVRPAGDGQYNARCPVHNDRQASLSIGASNDRVLIHCHANCGLGAILVAVGLQWTDIFLGDTQPGTVKIAQPVSLPRPVAERTEPKVSLPDTHVLAHWQGRIGEIGERAYKVKGWTVGTLQALGVGWDGERIVFPIFETGRRRAVDENHEPAGMVDESHLVAMVRYLPGGNPKSYAVGGRYLFPAPETLAGTNVWLVEGEPDSTTARELGIVATGVPGVAIWKQEWPERFKGRRVTVCFDCDREGREAAAKRVESLRAAGVEAQAIDLDPESDDGRDLSDLLVIALEQGRVSALKAYLAKLYFAAWEDRAAA